MTIAVTPADPCPCGSGRRYRSCCEPVHAGGPAASAEALMRSRYSAFVMGLRHYLLQSWHPSTRPADLDLSTESNRKWLGLSVKDHRPTGPDTAEVEFVARFREAGHAHRLHERSRFVREGSMWLYVDGDHVGE